MFRSIVRNLRGRRRFLLLAVLVLLVSAVGIAPRTAHADWIVYEHSMTTKDGTGSEQFTMYSGEYWVPYGYWVYLLNWENLNIYLDYTNDAWLAMYVTDHLQYDCSNCKNTPWPATIGIGVQNDHYYYSYSQSKWVYSMTAHQHVIDGDICSASDLCEAGHQSLDDEYFNSYVDLHWFIGGQDWDCCGYSNDHWTFAWYANDTWVYN